MVGSDDKQNTDKNMVARDVALISSDIDGKQDGYAIVSYIGLLESSLAARHWGQDCYTYFQFIR